MKALIFYLCIFFVFIAFYLTAVENIIAGVLAITNALFCLLLFMLLNYHINSDED